jgi:hypothetical protein
MSPSQLMISSSCMSHDSLRTKYIDPHQARSVLISVVGNNAFPSHRNHFDGQHCTLLACDRLRKRMNTTGINGTLIRDHTLCSECSGVC